MDTDPGTPVRWDAVNQYTKVKTTVDLPALVIGEERLRGVRDAGLRVLRPGAAGCGDAGLALGQAWIAAWARQHGQLAEPMPDAALAGI